MASELTRRNQIQSHPSPPPQAPSPPTSSRSRVVAAVLHRLFFVFVGIGIATLFFHAVLPKHSPPLPPQPPLHHHHPDVAAAVSSELPHRRVLYEAAGGGGRMNAGGKVRPGLKRKGLRIKKSLAGEIRCC